MKLERERLVLLDEEAVEEAPQRRAVRAAEGIDARDVLAVLSAPRRSTASSPPVAAIAPPNATVTVIAPTSAAKTTSRQCGARAIPRGQQRRARVRSESSADGFRPQAQAARADQVRVRVAASAEEKRDREDDQHERRDVAEAPPPKNQTFGKKAQSAPAIVAVTNGRRSSRARKKIAGKTSIAGDEIDRLQRAEVARDDASGRCGRARCRRESRADAGGAR